MLATAKGFVLKVLSQIFCNQKWAFSWNRCLLHHHSRNRTRSSLSQPQVSTSVSHSSPCSYRSLSRLASQLRIPFHFGSTGMLFLSSAEKRRLHESSRWRVLRIELSGLKATETHDWSLGSWRRLLMLGSSQSCGRGPLSFLALYALPLHQRRAPSHRDST